MVKDHQAKRLRKASHTGKVKVKSGCRTCKIRKIKCDEGRPSCHRCVSTGRICDGYGIWGDGGNGNGRRSIIPTGPRNNPNILSCTLPVSTLSTSTQEKDYFEWFRCRTATKLPGVFGSAFWDTLLFQVSSNEPAVLHAVLALSSAHKKATVYGISQKNDNIMDEQEQFILRQYSKSISHLQPHFSAKDRTSIRVALAVCYVFICLELLRGNYKTAQAHLQHGLMLLIDIQAGSSAMNDNALIPKYSTELVDDWIMEAFFRMHVQVELLRQSYQHQYLVLHASKPNLPALTFQSMSQARLHMDRLLHEILHLTEQGRQHEFSEHGVHPDELIDRQTRIKAELASWLRIFKASKTRLQAQMPVRDAFAYRLLRLYYTMADIMASTCLWSACEFIFDSHIHDFASLINQSINVFKAGSLTSKILYGNGIDMSKSIAEIGWIPPLYYTALKCRNHRVRLQAIKLLSSSSHKEGIWNSNLAVCIARKVMEIEERDFYKDVYKADDFNYCSPPEEQDLLLLPLPDEYRIHEVQVVLPDDPTGKTVLFCRWRQDDGSWDVLVSEYDVLSQCWTDRMERKYTSEI